MLNLTAAAITVVGGEACETLKTIDTAYAANLRFAADAVDALKASGLPAIEGQKLLENFNDGFDKAATWRRSVTSAIARLQVFHKKSNQAEVDGGCPFPFLVEFFVTGEKTAGAADPMPARVEA